MCLVSFVKGCALLEVDMSFEYSTRGFENYESFVLALVVCGIPYTEKFKGEPIVRGPFRLCRCRCELTREGGLTKCNCCKGECVHSQRLRIARFNVPVEKRMVVEEYIAIMSHDCDSEDKVAIAVYHEGARPHLFVEEVK